MIDFVIGMAIGAVVFALVFNAWRWMHMRLWLRRRGYK